MNYSIIRNIIGKIMILLAILMLFPLVCCVIYKEDILNYLSFFIPIFALLTIGFLFNIKKASNTKILSKEGLIIVGLSWLIMSLFGCLPFIISKEIPSFADAFFEITSGFTTTGATILDADDFSALSHSAFLWRSFTHWIGGMGVLVFILAFIPESKDGSSMHILRAESPGPQVGKLVSKMVASSRILYLIYIALTIIQILLLWLGPDSKMTFFHSLVCSLGTAGTGGFAMVGEGISYYSAYSQYVIAIFMVLFGINFSMYYFVLVKNYKEVLANEELRWYIGIIVVSIILIMINIYPIYNNFETTFRHAFFQTASVISTTGYSTAPYETWPALSHMILAFLMLIGACAGSTAGGLKISRLVILVKSSFAKIKNAISPRKIETIRIDKKPLDDNTVNSVQNYFVVYALVLIIVSIIISVDDFDFVTNFTASLTCISNVGPALGNIAGSSRSFSVFSPFSKIVLSIEMVAGRLELFPILILFYPKTWMK